MICVRSLAMAVITLALIATGRVLAYTPVRRLVTAIFCALFFITPAGALAADGSPTSEALSLLIKILGAILMIVLPLLLNRYLAPLLGARRVSLLSEIATMAVSAGEEYGQRRIKAGAKVKGSEKLEQAAAVFLGLAGRAGLRDIDQDEARRLIDAALNSWRSSRAR